jgi:hypothetical protein
MITRRKDSRMVFHAAKRHAMPLRAVSGYSLNLDDESGCLGAGVFSV